MVAVVVTVVSACVSLVGVVNSNTYPALVNGIHIWTQNKIPLHPLMTTHPNAETALGAQNGCCGSGKFIRVFPAL